MGNAIFALFLEDSYELCFTQKLARSLLESTGDGRAWFPGVAFLYPTFPFLPSQGSLPKMCSLTYTIWDSQNTVLGLRLWYSLASTVTRNVEGGPERGEAEESKSNPCTPAAAVPNPLLPVKLITPVSLPGPS